MVGETQCRASGASRSGTGGTPPVRLGVGLRQAWAGYRRQLDHELAAAGFGDRGFPDGRVLRLCTGASDVTISQIGRELGITRQGASKIVASLRDRGYVALSPSPTDRREKIVKPTRRAVAFLAAQREAARADRGAVLRPSWDDGAAATRCTGCSTPWAPRTSHGWPRPARRGERSRPVGVGPAPCRPGPRPRPG